jgi:hypothetical protein
VLARDVADERDQCRGHRADALDQPAEDDEVDRRRDRDDAAADREHEQGAQDHEAPPAHVAEQARGHLEDRLRQPVGAEREPDEERRGAGKSRGPGRHDRQRHVEAEHAERIDAARPEDGNELVAQEDGAGVAMCAS